MREDLDGPGVTPPRALRAVAGALPALELVDFRFSGKPVATDVIADGVYANAIVLGAPLTDVSALDLALEGLAGDLVMTGSVSALLRPKAGDTVRATFTRLGSVAARFV